MSKSSFSVQIKSRLRHGILASVEKQFSSQKEMAQYLEVSFQYLNGMINLRIVPDERWREKNILFLSKIEFLYGQPLEWGDLFPDQLKRRIESNELRTLETYRDVPLELLVEQGACSPRLLENPIEKIEEYEAGKILTKILNGLTVKERDIVSLHFGIYDGREWALREIGERLGVSPENVRQKLSKAFRKLRHDSRTIEFDKIKEIGKCGNIKLEYPIDYIPIAQREKDDWTVERNIYWRDRSIKLSKEKRKAHND